MQVTRPKIMIDTAILKILYTWICKRLIIYFPYVLVIGLIRNSPCAAELARSTLACEVIYVTDKLHGRKNYSSYGQSFQATSFVDYKAKAVNVKFPMVAAHDYGWLLSQLLNNH